MKKILKVLLLGATGQLGNLIAQKLRNNTQIELVVASRHQEQLDLLAAQYGNAVYLDLDKPDTLPDALQGIDHAFLLTSYTVNMVTQSKIFIDSAKKAGISYLVHLGVFSRDWDCTVPHFAWHQMIEAYIQQQEFNWTFLHPNCFMQNLSQFSVIHDGKLRWYTDKPCAWIALEDIAACAAKILCDGPELHHGKDYWLSTESLALDEMTNIITQVTGQSLAKELRSPENFVADLGLTSGNIDPYFYSVAESFRQVQDGRLACISEITEDVNRLLQRPGLTLSQWVTMHKDKFIELMTKAHSQRTEWGG